MTVAELIEMLREDWPLYVFVVLLVVACIAADVDPRDMLPL